MRYQSRRTEAAATDAPAARPVVRDAVRRAVNHAVDERVREARRYGTRAQRVPTQEPRAELVGLLDQLQSTVSDYVRGRRAEGVTVERVIPEVKCLVREAESCEGWLDPSYTLEALVIRWSILAYYDEARE